jgi:hypothetical protein
MWIKTSLAALGMMGALAAATPAPTLAQSVHVGPGAGQRVEVNIVLGPISPAGTLDPNWRACGVS